MAQACGNASEAEVLLVTAHRSKGLQFDQVFLDDDFAELVDRQGQSKHDGTLDFEQEVNLLYVAMTRAKKAVEFNRQIGAFVQAVKTGALQPVAPHEIPAILAATPISYESAVPSSVGVAPSAPERYLTDEKLAEGIERAILREGLLTAAAIGAFLQHPVDRVTRRIAGMIQAGELADGLFTGDSRVREALNMDTK